MKLNPEVYRLAARYLHRRKHSFSCHALRNAVDFVYRSWDKDSIGDMKALHCRHYTAMFGPSGQASIAVYRLGFVTDKYSSVFCEEFSAHPYWDYYDEYGKRNLRQMRINALLLMADIVEAGDTF